MSAKWRTTLLAALVAIAISPKANAQSAGNDAEVALLKQHLRLLEQKLDRLEQQNATNARNATTAKAEAKAALANTRAAAIPTKEPILVNQLARPSDVVVTMPNNRPTICTTDNQNCISLTSRLHIDAGGYDYRPNTVATTPQQLDDGANLRRA